MAKTHDDKTNIYGQLFKPTNFNAHRKCPIVDYLYPCPQIGSAFRSRFEPSHYDDQSLAELGFIIGAINGVGTSYRPASFHHLWYGDNGHNTLPDQVGAFKELARRYPWIDLSRVGIWGQSGGGNATADALFRYPEFFKVGWAESGDYDNRDYENDWGEKYQGLLMRHPDGATNLANQANELPASHLEGHLMLTCGTMDDDVPPENTRLVMRALIKADKNFDMLAMPNVQHEAALGPLREVSRRQQSAEALCDQALELSPTPEWMFFQYGRGGSCKPKLRSQVRMDAPLQGNYHTPAGMMGRMYALVRHVTRAHNRDMGEHHDHSTDFRRRPGRLLKRPEPG